MSLATTSLIDIVKKQYYYKLKAYQGSLGTLVFVQLLAILFSFGGVGMLGTGSENFSLNIHYYSADMVIVFTMFWAFITGILITTKAYRYDDFTFVTNRVGSNLSNTLFLLTASCIGGITAILSGFLLKVLMYYVVGNRTVIGLHLTKVPFELLLGMVATIFYLLLFSALGYLIGTLVQLHKTSAILLPIIFLGTLFLGVRNGDGGIVVVFSQMFFTEASFGLFLIKVLVTVGLCFSSAILLSNRMEVRV